MGAKTFAILLVPLLFGGCPKRQTVPRVVYVPAPAAAANPTAGAPVQASTEPSGTPGSWVIEEPAPPAPPPVETQEAPPPAPAPAPAVQRSRRTRPETQETEEATPAVDPNQPAIAGETPQLQPQSSPATREEIQKRQSDLEGRINGIQHNLRFTAVDRRTLEDARGFLVQSERALQAGDMLRAEQLAEKASLLLAALEQK